MRLTVNQEDAGSTPAVPAKVSGRLKPGTHCALAGLVQQPPVKRKTTGSIPVCTAAANTHPTLSPGSGKSLLTAFESLAQRIERLALTQDVVGSNPTGLTMRAPNPQQTDP